MRVNGIIVLFNRGPVRWVTEATLRVESGIGIMPWRDRALANTGPPTVGRVGLWTVVPVM